MNNKEESTEEEIVATQHPFEGLKDGNQRMAKAKVAKEINLLLKERGLKQQDAAKLLDITQPEVSDLSRGKLSRFTFDRLYRCLHALDVDIEITLKRHIPTNTLPVGVEVSSFIDPHLPSQ